MNIEIFADLTDVYDSLVNWEQRLSREAPFYRRLFAQYEVNRVVDVACGTGHHAAMFHGWGLDVEGADLSLPMLSRARTRYGEPPGLSWTQRGFESEVGAMGDRDAVVCVGNSLPLAGDNDVAFGAVRAMLARVRAGGIVIVHLLNLWSRLDGPTQWQKCIAWQHDDAPAVVSKGIHRSGDRGYVDLIICGTEPPVLLWTQSLRFLGVTAEQLEGWATTAGGEVTELLGDYQGAHYVPEESADLIAVFRKRG